MFGGIWHLYVASTFDGGASWRPPTPRGPTPVQRGSICTGGTTCGNDRNLLDFIDATVDPQGRVLMGYADGCTAACVTTTAPVDGVTAGYRDAYATIARQSSGPRMLAAFDPVTTPDLTVSGLQAAKDTSGAVVVSALVANEGGSPATGVTTSFTDGRKAPFGTTAPITLAAGASQRVSVVWKGATNGKTVTAVVDPQNAVVESDETNNKAASTLTVR